MQESGFGESQSFQYFTGEEFFQHGALAKRHGVIHRELKRRSAIEPVIGHMKNDGHLGRNFLKGYAGNQANAVLTAIGHNFRLILA